MSDSISNVRCLRYFDWNALISTLAKFVPKFKGLARSHSISRKRYYYSSNIPVAKNCNTDSAPETCRNSCQSKFTFCEGSLKIWRKKCPARHWATIKRVSWSIERCFKILFILVNFLANDDRSSPLELFGYLWENGLSLPAQASSGQ